MTRIALLFDLDGTLVDSDALHERAFATVLAERGRGLEPGEYTEKIMGQPNMAIMAHLLPDDPAAHGSLAERKEALFRESLAGPITPTNGTATLLDWAEESGAAVAVVTNAPRANAEAMLAAAGLAQRLRVVIIGDECARPKPDSAPYQQAMAILGVPPSRAVAFEDSRAGLRAARGSGAHVFGLSTAHDDAELLRSGAHQAIADFTDPVLWTHLETLKARAA